MRTATKSTRTSEGRASVDDEVSAGAASRQIDARIASLDDWRGAMLAQVRALIHEADADVVEEWKWRGVPVWSHDGILCTGETYKAAVKLTFAKGAALADPTGLFNASLEGNVRRAIDLREGDAIDEPALAALIRAAVALNAASAGAKATKKAAGAAKSAPAARIAKTRSARART